MKRHQTAAELRDDLKQPKTGFGGAHSLRSPSSQALSEHFYTTAVRRKQALSFSYLARSHFGHCRVCGLSLALSLPIFPSSKRTTVFFRRAARCGPACHLPSSPRLRRTGRYRVPQYTGIRPVAAFRFLSRIGRPGSRLCSMRERWPYSRLIRNEETCKRLPTRAWKFLPFRLQTNPFLLKLCPIFVFNPNEGALNEALGRRDLLGRYRRSYSRPGRKGYLRSVARLEFQRSFFPREISLSIIPVSIFRPAGCPTNHCQSAD
jgi:hypothetical protein